MHFPYLTPLKRTVLVVSFSFAAGFLFNKYVSLNAVASYVSLYLSAGILGGAVECPVHIFDAARVASHNGPAYPLKISANKRYLVDQNNRPFLLMGDSPQTVVGKMTEADAEYYFANREQYGINALWIHVMCRDNETCNRNAATPDGIVPFLTAGDITTPNPAYFQRLENIINIAAKHGIVLLLTPAETSGWLDTLRHNGPAKAYMYGEYLGRRYRTFPNIIWMHGNDFQTWTNPEDDGVVLAVARGIHSTDPDHLHTIELNYLNSASLEDARWKDIIKLDGIYSYFPTYAQTLSEYNRTEHWPTFLQEASYEFEHNDGTAGGSLANLRRQEYWAALSGSTGQLYGSKVTWTLPFAWKFMLDTKGIQQFSLMRAFFVRCNWQDLVPDQEHRIVVDGYGDAAPVGTGSVETDTYATTAATPDKALVVTYIPTSRTITVNNSELQKSTAARWYDPTDGTFRTAQGIELGSDGLITFATPGKNHGGDEDWVLRLDAR
jgi:hypothetical protein